MDCSVPEKSALFSGVPAAELRAALEETPHRIQRYDKGEIIFHMMEPATRTGILLEGRVEAQKSFPNGSQVNVSVRAAGEMIGPAAVFSKSQKYPCDIVAMEPVTVMMFRREDLLRLMQKDIRILENFTAEIASATYMLQQRLELFSYRGIAQKAAFWLLMQARQTGKAEVRIPGSVSKWAMLMNVSRPSLHRELKRMEEQSLISCRPPVIGILNPAALQDVLSL
ncbi:MAG: Crp/Fnr family transcriptional regulator [Fretibacterium sp.]|nr:Crp/Fnr family transcriptional regulator [Fretibacterium sp.]